MWLERHPQGRLFFAPLDVILSHHNVVEPDLLYASHERAREIMTGHWVRGAPELVVAAGGGLPSELFPGLEMPLARVFASSAT